MHLSGWCRRSFTVLVHCRNSAKTLRVIHAGSLLLIPASFKVPLQFKMFEFASLPSVAATAYLYREGQHSPFLSSAEAFLGIADFHFIPFPVNFYSNSKVRSSSAA